MTTLLTRTEQRQLIAYIGYNYKTEFTVKLPIKKGQCGRYMTMEFEKCFVETQVVWTGDDKYNMNLYLTATMADGTVVKYPCLISKRKGLARLLIGRYNTTVEFGGKYQDLRDEVLPF